MTHRKSISAYISTIALFSLLLFPATLHAQENKEKGKGKWLTDVEVSVDIVGPCMKAFGSYGHYEAAARLNLRGRYFPIVEIGYAKCDKEEDTNDLTYTTSAPFFKIGCDFNLLKNKNDDYRLYIGFRYAYTSFDFDIDSPGVEDPVWGGYADYSVTGNECSYMWLEAVGGVQAKICGPLHLGWSIRYCARVSDDCGDLGEAWYVPGYGTAGKSNFAATFDIIFVI